MADVSLIEYKVGKAEVTSWDVTLTNVLRLQLCGGTSVLCDATHYHRLSYDITQPATNKVKTSQFYVTQNWDYPRTFYFAILLQIKHVIFLNCVKLKIILIKTHHYKTLPNQNN